MECQKSQTFSFLVPVHAPAKTSLLSFNAYWLGTRRAFFLPSRGVSILSCRALSRWELFIFSLLSSLSLSIWQRVKIFAAPTRAYPHTYIYLSSRSLSRDVRYVYTFFITRNFPRSFPPIAGRCVGRCAEVIKYVTIFKREATPANSMSNMDDPLISLLYWYRTTDIRRYLF